MCELIRDTDLNIITLIMACLKKYKLLVGDELEFRLVRRVENQKKTELLGA